MAPKLTSLVLLLCALCQLTTVRALFNFPDFQSTVELNLQNAQKDGKEILLAGSQQQLTSSVWFRQPIWLNLDQGFTTKFSFRMNGGDNGADGFAFVIQGAGSYVLGDDASGLGYGSIKQSIAFEFDTYKNGDLNDPNNNHISVHTRGPSPNSAYENSGYPLYWQATDIPKLNSNQVHRVTLVYTPARNGQPGSFSLLLNDKLLTTTPITFPRDQPDIPSLLKLSQPLVHVGFTGATGGKFQDHYISSWDFSYSNLFEACAFNFQNSTQGCTPVFTDSVASCAAYSNCFLCATSPYPCAWSGDYNTGRCSAGSNGVSSYPSCPTAPSYVWVWIVCITVAVLAGTAAVFYFWRKKQMEEKGNIMHSTNY